MCQTFDYFHRVEKCLLPLIEINYVKYRCDFYEFNQNLHFKHAYYKIVTTDFQYFFFMAMRIIY